MYGRAKDLVRLAIWMQGAALGVSLEQIQEEFGVERRTAERMRDAVNEVWGPLEVYEGDDHRRRWSAPASPDGIPQVTAEELAYLAAAADLLRAQARPEAAGALDAIATRLQAAHGRRGLARLELDFEALTEIEGLAARPGPRVRYDPHILESLRDSILRRRIVRLGYRTVGTGRVGSHMVEPYGFLHGTRSYLVAYDRTANGWRTFRLSNVLGVEETGEGFQRDPDFSLEKFAGRSFGVFQEEPFDVVWKFNPAAAESAREFVFHPDQITEELSDGSLLVKFRAGGAREMSWHLHQWGDTVEVVEPEGFWERVR